MLQKKVLKSGVMREELSRKRLSEKDWQILEKE